MYSDNNYTNLHIPSDIPFVICYIKCLGLPRNPIRINDIKEKINYNVYVHL